MHHTLLAKRALPLQGLTLRLNGSQQPLISCPIGCGMGSLCTISVDGIILKSNWKKCRFLLKPSNICLKSLVSLSSHKSVGVVTLYISALFGTVASFAGLHVFLPVRTVMWLSRMFWFNFVFSNHFLNVFQSDDNSITVYVLGHLYVLAHLSTYFNPRLTACAKVTLSQTQNISVPANINSIVLFSFLSRMRLGSF